MGASEQDALNPAGGNLPHPNLHCGKGAFVSGFLVNKGEVQIELILPW